MIKLLLIIPQATSYNTFLKDIAKQMHEDDGYELHLSFSPQNLEGVDCYEDSCFGTFHPVAFPRGWNPLKHLKAAIELRKIVEEIKPDIIHAHFSSSAFTLALAKKRAWSATCIATVHGLVFALCSGFRRLIAGNAEVWSINRLDKTWVLTQDDLDVAQEKCKKNKVEIYNAPGLGCRIETFDRSKFSERKLRTLKLENNIQDSDFVFIFIGRFVVFKGFSHVVKSFLEINRQHKNTKLILAGVPDKQHPTGLNAEETNAMLACEDIINLGWINNICDYLAISDVNVFPSVREGYPVNVMEALVMGVPVITFDSRGCRDAVKHLKNGLVLQERTTNAVKTGMLQLFHDKNLLKELSNNAINERSFYDRKNYIKEQLEIYQELVNS